MKHKPEVLKECDGIIQHKVKKAIVEIVSQTDPTLDRMRYLLYVIYNTSIKANSPLFKQLPIYKVEVQSVNL